LKINLKENAIIKAPQTFEVVITATDEVISNLQSELKINIEQITEGIIGISLVGLSSNKNDAIINELISEHQKSAIEQKNNIAVKTNKFLENRLVLIEEKLDSIEKIGRNIRSANGIIDIATEFPAMLIEEQKLEAEVFELGVNESLADQMIDFLKSDEDYESLIPVNLGFESNTLSASISGYNQLVLERNNLLSSSSEINPLVVSRKNDIIRLRANLKRSIESYQSSVRDQKKRVLAKLSTYAKKKSSIPEYELDYKDIMRDQQIRESIYLLLLQKKEENEIVLASTESNIRVIDYAYSELEPVAPNKKIIFLLAAILGLALPILFFYLKNLLNNKLKDVGQLEKIGLPVIGEIPFVKGEFIDLIKSRNAVTESFITLRTNIRFLLKKEAKNVIVVTSTKSGEGKTFVSLNLARSLGASGKKVVLLGLDLRLPKLLEYMNMPYSIGVSDYISDEQIDLNSIVYKQDQIEGVDFIPCGTIPPNPSELLLRDRFMQMIEELKEKYDTIIIDTSPIGLVSDTLSLAGIAYLLVYVVRINYLESDLLLTPDKLFKEKKFKSMTMLVNGTVAKEDGYSYGYLKPEKKKGIMSFFRSK
jgi:capsular exopolysaccharide synthesis family protein